MPWLQEGEGGHAWVQVLVVLGGSHWVQWLLFPGFTEACFLGGSWAWQLCAPRMHASVLQEDRTRRENTSLLSPSGPWVRILTGDVLCMRNGAVGQQVPIPYIKRKLSNCSVSAAG